MDIFDVNKVELTKIYKQGEDTWVRDLEVETEDGETFTLTLFANTEEALQVEISETKKI